MPYGDGILKINCYSLTDFHDFDDCPLRFFVRHHLDRKYEIDESNSAIALGNLLDQAMKKFHKANYYGCEPEELVGLVRASAIEMKDEVEKAKLKGRSHFYAATIPFLTEDIIAQATQIFQDYYLGVNKKIKKSLGEVGFCEWTIAGDGDSFKLWGGPDALEMGEDGVPEIVDYKSRQNIEKGKASIDMDLMPKIYTLLCAKKLLGMGHQKARFMVRFWQDPKENGYYEEFDLEMMNGEEFLFKQKIDRILRTSEFMPCNRKWCGACKSVKKDEFIKELEGKGLKALSGEEFLER